MRTAPSDYGSNGQDERDPATIARAIDETRGEVDETLDALQARLSPGQMLDRAMEVMRTNGGRFAGNLGRTVRDNPLPVILTGVGLAWMMTASRSAEPTSAPPASRTGRVGERLRGASEKISGAASDTIDTVRDSIAGARDRVAGARDSIAGARDSIAGVAASVSESASNVAGTISDEVSAATDRVKDQSYRLRDAFSGLLRDQPLLVGAVGIALGALLGYALPASDTEDRLLGEASDATTRQAVDAAKEQVSKVSEAASGALNEGASVNTPDPANRDAYSDPQYSDRAYSDRVQGRTDNT